MKSMDIRKILLIPLLCGLVFTSCNDDPEETYFTFEGEVKTEETLPSYANPGETYSVTPYGIRKDSTDPDDPKITYSFMLTPGMTSRDTMDTFIFIVPDTLCTAQVQVYVSAPGYNTATSEYSIAIIDPEKSLTNITHNPQGGTFTDPRDSRQYPYTTIAGLDWMTKNLAYCAFGKAYKGIKDSGYEAMSDVFGMYYTWDEAMAACPEGWRLPSDGDWTSMCQTLTDTPLSPLGDFPGIAGKLMGNGYLNSERLWVYYTICKPEPEASYMNLLPTGYANKSGDTYTFDSTLGFCAYWTSTEADAEKAYCRYLYNNEKIADVLAHPLYKEFVATPVRCVRDSE
jgi:uncharacterized protein (TIGR02145 family)